VKGSLAKARDKEPYSKEGHSREQREAGAAQVDSGEDTGAWLAKDRRLTIRYERRDDIHEAFLHLGCSLICLNYLT
jgi:hypothetical protein